MSYAVLDFCLSAAKFNTFSGRIDVGDLTLQKFGACHRLKMT